MSYAAVDDLVARILDLDLCAGDAVLIHSELGRCAPGFGRVVHALLGTGARLVFFGLDAPEPTVARGASGWAKSYEDAAILCFPLRVAATIATTTYTEAVRGAVLRYDTD